MYDNQLHRVNPTDTVKEPNPKHFLPVDDSDSRGTFALIALQTDVPRNSVKGSDERVDYLSENQALVYRRVFSNIVPLTCTDCVLVFFCPRMMDRVPEGSTNSSDTYSKHN
ncbi:hypothetical protein L596_001626 [Steinernema carpocapsae]|uniref:Uncharacterized protein n=1 Tax=Steinernema carpocapsae TaxID=34508 RepID=A0A4U8UQP9_STECR|nr:hypothetical protein L596_001626 [Steinernema carpocapsae]